MYFTKSFTTLFLAVVAAIMMVGNPAVVMAAVPEGTIPEGAADVGAAAAPEAGAAPEAANTNNNNEAGLKGLLRGVARKLPGNPVPIECNWW